MRPGKRARPAAGAAQADGQTQRCRGAGERVRPWAGGGGRSGRSPGETEVTMGRAMGAEVKRLWGGASSRSEGPGGHTCLTTRSPACPGTLGLHPRPPAPAERGARKEVQDTRSPLPRSGHSILNTRPDSPSHGSGGLGSSPPPEATGSSTSGGQPPHRSNEGASQPGTASVVHVSASRVTFWKACCHEGGFLHPHPGGFGSPGSPRGWRRCRPHPDSWTRRLSPGQNRKPREEAC